MTEMDLLNEIRLNVQRMGCTSFRCNVGKVRTPDGRFFDTGLPKGFSDLLVVGKEGEAIFIETKIAPNKPTEQQCKFLLSMIKQGCKAGVAYSVADSTDIIKWNDDFADSMIKKIGVFLNGYCKSTKRD